MKLSFWTEDLHFSDFESHSFCTQHWAKALLEACVEKDLFESLMSLVWFLLIPESLSWLMSYWPKRSGTTSGEPWCIHYGGYYTDMQLELTWEGTFGGITITLQEGNTLVLVCFVLKKSLDVSVSACSFYIKTSEPLLLKILCHSQVV